MMSRVRPLSSFRWGGIGCRVAFIMSLAILMVSAFISAFLFWEGSRSRETEIRGRALFIGRYVSARVAEDIISGSYRALERTLMLAAAPQDGTSPDILYLQAYDRAGMLLAASKPPGGGQAARSVGSQLETDVITGSGHQFRSLGNGEYDLIMPVLLNQVRVGFVRVGVSGRDVEQLFGTVTNKAFIAGVVLLLLGLLFSQIIAIGITRPVAELSAAVEDLGRQNWSKPVPVKGRDELSRLASAFNQMAQKLREREARLSSGNRDLFILHTAGLDLMETLDLETLVSKIAARAEDLVRADTVTVAAVDRSTHAMRYLGVSGSKAHLLKGLDMPLEAGGIYNWTASYGTPLLIQDAREDVRLDPEQTRSLGIRSLIAVPLWSSNTMMALLTVINKKGGTVFDKQDLRLFTVFANIVGGALQNAYLYSDLKLKMRELNSAQQQLVQSAKMAAIGELAANVAHEINNPLTSVLGYTSHLLRTLDIPEESRRKLSMMEKETLRARKIIRNLLDFSRHRTHLMQAGDVAQLLREAVVLLQDVAGSAGIRIIEDYPPAPVIIRMDHTEIKQVFINIMTNALHAMPGGGELSVRVSAGGDGEAIIAFTDSGSGIPKEHLRRIFDPFFSTKGSSGGTGLGLSISDRIVQHHGGRIEVESEVGSGSSFRVILPFPGHSAVKESKSHASV